MSNESANYYKVVLLGEGRVGKTSILLRYVENSYVEGRPSTLQASYLDKHVVLDDNVDEINYSSSSTYNYQRNNRNPIKREAQLSIWDTAGQERFHSLGPIYYRDAKGALLVYDITDRPTFERVRNWTKELRKMVGDNSKICIFIVGNKLDLERQSGRAVDAEEAQKYADSVGAGFLEVSAKTGSGVEKVFNELTRKMLDTVKTSHRSRSSLANASSSMSTNPNQTDNNRINLTQETKTENNTYGCC